MISIWEKPVILSYALPKLCSVKFTDKEGSKPEKYGKGTLEVRFHEFGLPYPSGLMLLRPEHRDGVLTVHSTDILERMGELRRYPHLRQINRISQNRYDMILTCYQWTDEEIEARRHCLPLFTRECPSIDYTLTFNVDHSNLAMVNGLA